MSDDYGIWIDENGVGHLVIGSDLDDMNTPEEALKKAYEKGKADGIAEANLNHNTECGDCVRQITAADESKIRAEAVKNFAEWLSRKHGINTCVGLINGNLGYKELDVDEVLKQWKREGE